MEEKKLASSADLPFDNPLNSDEFSYNNCFLCGVALDNNNSSEEHIYPQWLQKEFNLWNQKLILLNQKTINYKSLKIPCCKSCNEILGKKIEKPIQKAYKGGYEEFNKLDKTIIFNWLNKIAYGTLYKELSMRFYLDDPESRKIYTKEFLNELNYMQYIFLQSIRFNTQLINKPYSIFIFKIKEHDKKDYWAGDFTFTNTFCMQLNDVGIIACFQDSGYNWGFFNHFPKQQNLLQEELHPIQIRELCAQIIYKASTFNRNPFYTYSFNKDAESMFIHSHNINGDAYDDWDNDTYMRLLKKLLEPWEKMIILQTPKDSKLPTFLFDEKGNFIRNLIEEQGTTEW